MSEQVRSITIKTGIVRRLAKELGMYREEERQEKEKVKKLKDSGADPYDIKYAVCWYTEQVEAFYNELVCHVLTGEYYE